jgi:hypothetical protein
VPFEPTVGEDGEPLGPEHREEDDVLDAVAAGGVEERPDGSDPDRRRKGDEESFDVLQRPAPGLRVLEVERDDARPRTEPLACRVGIPRGDPDPEVGVDLDRRCGDAEAVPIGERGDDARAHPSGPADDECDGHARR